MALPTVGTKALHTVQLSPKVRKILQHRAAEASRRAYAPVLAEDQGAFREANQAYGAEKGSITGATHLLENALTQALSGLKSSGLTGGYLKRAQNELVARQGDAAESIPFLLAGANEERKKALGSARSELASDRASMLQNSAEGFNSLLASARSAGSQSLKEQDEAKEAEAKKKDEESHPQFDPTSLSNARLALKDFLTAWKENPLVKDESTGEEVPLQSLNPLQSKADWLKTAAGLDHQYSGFGLSEANAVITQLLQRRKAEQEEHDTPAATVARQINPW
jgi:hypothetical protein